MWGTIDTIPYAVKEIKEIINTKLIRKYVVTKHILLPKNLINKLKKNSYELLKQLKQKYKLDNISIVTKNTKSFKYFKRKILKSNI